MRRLSLSLFAVLFIVAPIMTSAQSITRLAHQAPDGIIIAFQMTDGTVIGQGFGETDWWRLTPDNKGSYVNGTWTQVASLPSGYSPDAFASAVLADGRLLIEGGEYNFDSFDLTNLGAIYDLKANTWTNVPPPPKWAFIGDSPSAVLPNGDFLIGNKLVKNMAVLNPKTMQWRQGIAPGKADFNAEEGWTLMPDGTIFTFDVKAAPHAERFLPSKLRWISAGDTPADMHSPSPFGCLPYGDHGQYCYFPPGEIGPAVLRPDGTVFATGSYTQDGSPAKTAVYTPGAHLGDTGTWKAGPNFPNGDDAGDSFAALLPNGDVLVEGESGTLYVFNGTTLATGPFAGGSLLVLPTGQILIGGTEVYNAAGTYQASWAPTISNSPSTVTRGSSYQISGTQFNGLSQANSFGDEFETATNYPLVRITNNASGHVFYAFTHDHSTMGVATGSKPVSTNFDVPANMETGASKLEVVANGIPSVAVNITVN